MGRKEGKGKGRGKGERERRERRRGKGGKEEKGRMNDVATSYDLYPSYPIKLKLKVHV